MVGSKINKVVRARHCTEETLDCIVLASLRVPPSRSVVLKQDGYISGYASAGHATLRLGLVEVERSECRHHARKQR